jgi:hypothetical protein
MTKDMSIFSCVVEEISTEVLFPVFELNCAIVEMGFLILDIDPLSHI